MQETGPLLLMEAGSLLLESALHVPPRFYLPKTQQPMLRLISSILCPSGNSAALPLVMGLFGPGA